MNLLSSLTRSFQLIPPEPSWAWAEREIDYSRALSYDTPYRGRFDADLMPFWKEPLESARDPDVREVDVIKCSRGGYSENFVLTDMRYGVAVAPEPSLYITGKMDLAKGFMDRRAKRGMALSKQTRAKYARAHSTGMDIPFEDMDFRVTWASSDTATKQDGWARIYCDEVDLWAEFTVDMVRRRCAAYPFHHIIWGGSIDPTRKGNPEESPIIKLHEESDKRVWAMPDPVTENDFTWSHSGIRWPDDCKTDDEWDLTRVESESWYVTPDGTRIDEADRMDVTRTGQWRVTNPDGIRRGYKVVAPMVPFLDCGFGALGKAFLSAKYRMNLTGKREDRINNTLRTYFAEYWAEAHRDQEVQTGDTALADRESDYELGKVQLSRKGAAYGVNMTGDVQQFHIWHVERLWESIGDKVTTRLINYGTVPTFADLDEIAAEVGPGVIGIDARFRNTEVADFCAQYTPQDDPHTARVFAMMGDENMKAAPTDLTVHDAFIGRKSAHGQALYCRIMWQSDYFRSWLIEALNGLTDWGWQLPDKWGEDGPSKRAQYGKQVASTKKIDGVWVKPGHGQDHMFDCECMHLVLARFDGLIS